MVEVTQPVVQVTPVQSLIVANDPVHVMIVELSPDASGMHTPDLDAVMISAALLQLSPIAAMSVSVRNERKHT